MSPYRTTVHVERRCPNCYDPMPTHPPITPSGVPVCCPQCVSGWMNGEYTLHYLELVRNLRVLLNDE